MTASIPTLPVAVIGAGPVGLAAAAHLLARGFTPILFEAGAAAGANLLTYGHVRLFSPWRYNLDKAAKELLIKHGWREPAADVLPTAAEVVRSYLQPLAETLAPHIRFAHRIVSITRLAMDKVKTARREAFPFVLRVSTEQGEQEFLAQAVIDASGTWNQPNPLGANGLPALNENAFRRQIAYGMPDILGSDKERYAGKRVLVVGAGHSAAGNLIALAELATAVSSTQIVWAVRGENWTRIFGGGAADQLPARGELGRRVKQLRDSGQLHVHASFRVHEIKRENNRMTIVGLERDGERPTIAGVDEIIVSTGARPNLEMTRELRVKHDPWLESTEALAPLIDPNEHSCGTVRPHGHRELAHPEHGYYAVGAKSYGRAPTFLMATGYEQVRSVVAALAGDLAAADDVQLELPETGVCSVSFAPAERTGGACCPVALRQNASTAAAADECCGGPAQSKDACCVADERAKLAGERGCGCAATPSIPPVHGNVCCA